MSEIYSITLFTVVALTWFMSLIQSHRLFYKFRGKYPDLAKREIPYAFDFRPHPEKYFYFLRQKCKVILSEDLELLKLRRQVIILTWGSVLVPCIGFLLLLIIMVVVAI